MQTNQKLNGKYCYINGTYLERQFASISVDDLGLLRGYGVFDFIRTYKGRPFLLEEHLVRLQQSAKEINLHLPFSFDTLKRTVLELLKKNALRESTIRIIVTGGRTVDGLHPSTRTPSLIILVDKLPNIKPSVFKQGVKLITTPYSRFLPRAKTLDYVSYTRLLDECKGNSAYNILYTKNNMILEAATCNFFAFKHNQLVTANRNVLAGITRQVVLDLAKGEDNIVERALHINELKECSEAFLTGTTQGIVPVVQIDDQVIGTGKVGTKTKRLMAKYSSYIRSFIEQP